MPTIVIISFSLISQNKTKSSPPPPPPPRSRCFLGCFGFSRKVVKSAADHHMGETGGRKMCGGFSWSRLRVKISACKTVPVDETSVSHKVNRNSKEIPAVAKSSIKKKISSKGQNQIPAAESGPIPTQISITLPNQTLSSSHKPSKTRFQTTQSIILVNRKNVDHGTSNSLKDNITSQTKSLLPLTRKTTGVKRAHVGSPENKLQLGRTTLTFSHSVSFPPPKQKKQAAITTENRSSRVNSTTENRSSRVNSAVTHHQKFDPVVGISIIVTILTIMLVWGRLCAVLCTSAWFYIAVPRFRQTVGSNITTDKNAKGSSFVRSDLIIKDEEYKKKVVLEGLLERNHRSYSVIL